MKTFTGSLTCEDRGASAKSILHEGNSLMIGVERGTCRSESRSVQTNSLDFR